MPRKTSPAPIVSKVPSPVTKPSSTPAPAASAIPGILSQIATTSAGVALGNVVSHHILGKSVETWACAKELEAFLSCAKENSNDLNLCIGAVDKSRQCSTN